MKDLIRYSPGPPITWSLPPSLDLGSPIMALGVTEHGGLVVETEMGAFTFVPGDWVGTPLRLRWRERLRVRLLIWVRRLEWWITRL